MNQWEILSLCVHLSWRKSTTFIRIWRALEIFLKEDSRTQKVAWWEKPWFLCIARFVQGAGVYKKSPQMYDVVVGFEVWKHTTWTVDWPYAVGPGPSTALCSTPPTSLSVCHVCSYLSTCVIFEECLDWKDLDKHTLQIVQHLCSCCQDIYIETKECFSFWCDSTLNTPIDLVLHTVQWNRYWFGFSKIFHKRKSYHDLNRTRTQIYDLV